eukprot:scaffold3830_cov324-Prasinococcus_capsulatus_cf.AAC.1
MSGPYKRRVPGAPAESRAPGAPQRPGAATLSPRLASVRTALGRITCMRHPSSNGCVWPIRVGAYSALLPPRSGRHMSCASRTRKRVPRPFACAPTASARARGGVHSAGDRCAAARAGEAEVRAIAGVGGGGSDRAARGAWPRADTTLGAGWGRGGASDDHGDDKRRARGEGERLACV